MKTIYTYQIVKSRSASARRRHDPTRAVLYSAIVRAGSQYDALRVAGIKPRSAEARRVDIRVVGTSIHQ